MKKKAINDRTRLISYKVDNESGARLECPKSNNVGKANHIPRSSSATGDHQW